MPVWGDRHLTKASQMILKGSKKSLKLKMKMKKS